RSSRNTPGGTAPGGIFSRHDFQPKSTSCEQNVWGVESGTNSFMARMELLKDGINFRGAWVSDRETIIDPLLADNKPNLSSAAVFHHISQQLSDEGVMTFTLHHTDQEGKVWEVLLERLCETGFEIIAVYPIHAESETSLHLMNKENISYDLIHVCRKRKSDIQ